MLSKIEEFNEYYQFMRCAIVHFYSKCNDESYNRYYSQFLDNGLKLQDYFDFLEIMYTNLYEGK